MKHLSVALLALCSLFVFSFPAHAQDQPRPHILSLDDLPRVQTWSHTSARPDTLHDTHTSAFVLRVKRNLPSHYTPIGDAHQYAVVTLLAVPDNADEPGIFVTSENFTRNASSFEVLSKGTWHSATLIYSNKDLGLSALHVDLPENHPRTPRSLRSSNDPSLQPKAIQIHPQHAPKLISATLGKRGEDVLGFFNGVTPSLPPGTPLFDEDHNIVAIVALNLPQRKPHAWAISTQPIRDFLAEVLSPTQRNRPKDNTVQVTLEPR